jgi:hypothetical protein
MAPATIRAGVNGLGSGSCVYCFALIASFASIGGAKDDSLLLATMGLDISEVVLVRSLIALESSLLAKLLRVTVFFSQVISRSSHHGTTGATASLTAFSRLNSGEKCPPTPYAEY